MQRFWGIEVEPNKPVTFTPDFELRLTRVALAADAKSDDRNVLQITVYEQKKFVLGSLQLGKKEQFGLDLVLDREEEVTFSVQGKSKVNILGYYEYDEADIEELMEMGDSDDELEHEHEQEVETPQPKSVKETTNNKRKAAEQESPKAQQQAEKQTKQKKAVAESEKSSNETATTPAKKTKTAEKEKESPKPKEAAKNPAIIQHKSGLIVEEIQLGNGPQPQQGKNISVHYRGYLLKNGKQFDASLNKPFSFRFGIGSVIKGWDLGLRGMRVGGKRKLTIPPQLGYGSSGAPPDIPPNATLVFEVELLAARQ